MDEVIARFNTAGVRYLLIGGQAMRLEGMPRFSMDWDFFIADDPANLERIQAALGTELDLPLVPRGPQGQNLIQTYQTRWGVTQFHLAVPGLPSFETAWSRRKQLETENGAKAECVSIEDLLAAKRASGRPQDLLDIEFLEHKIRGG